MDTTTISDASSSMAEFLEKEKIYKDICRSITEGVSPTSEALQVNSSLSPGINDDEINALLRKMSQILTPDEKDHVLGSSDDRSVDVILKEAEDLIRSSTPLFHNLSSDSSTNTWPPSQRKLVAPCNVTQVLTKGDNSSDSKASSARSGGRSNFSVSEANDQLFNDIVNNKKQDQECRKKPQELLLSDLVDPQVVDEDVPLQIDPKVNVEHHQEVKQGNRKIVEQKHASKNEPSQKPRDDKMFDLKQQINFLNAKIKDYECKDNNGADKIQMLEAELKTQEQLIAGYQRENLKLCQEINAFKEHWKQRENQLIGEKQQLQNELHGVMSVSMSESLKEQLKDAQETIVKLQLELTTSKSTSKELELTCDRLRSDVIRLETEVSNYRCQVTELNKRDDRTAANAVLATTTALSAQLTDARNLVARKDAEIVRLNTSLGTLRAELNRKQTTNPTKQNLEIETLNVTISQLQAALSLERDQCRELNREKDALLREIVDLKRQVRELEIIVKRRNRSDSQIPVMPQNDRARELEKELGLRQESLTALHCQLQEMQKKYEDHIKDLEGRLKIAQLENQSLNITKTEQVNNRSSAKKPTNIKEDAHLLATIRGLKQELASKEKDIVKLNKELDDARKTNKRLQREREKQLTHKTPRGSSLVEKVSSLAESVGSSLSSSKPYNPLIFSEVDESVTALKSENKTLQTEVKRLEQDLITMHGKRVHDLNALQAEHDLEISRLLNDHAARHSQSQMADLQGQVYTQQVVISHLKHQLKQAEELKEETAILRAERSHLEEALIELKKNLDSLKTLQTPESAKQESVLAMLENIKRNSEMREQKLQAIVRDLLTRTSQSDHCNGGCCKKLLDKNRQLCYYCSEMDKLLEPLREFRRKI